MFRAYDIRGIYPSELNEEKAYKIARSCVTVFKPKKVLVGRDGRISSPAIKSSVIKGLLDSGCEVHDVDLIPTSGFNFLISHKNFDLGLMITASHNPREYNGIKVYKRGGITIGLNSGLNKVKEIYNKEDFMKGEGKLIEYKELVNDYTNFLRSFCNFKLKKRVIVDFSNGCGSIVFPKIASKIDIRYNSLNSNIDGRFPAHEPEPNEENLRDLIKIIKSNGYDLGIAFDGDADRIAFLDERGKLLNGEIVTYILAKHYRPKKVVFEVSFSEYFKDVMKRLNIEPIESRVGRVFIIENMRKNGAEIGGEISNHFYFKESDYMDDAFLALIKFLKVIFDTEKKVSKLYSEYPNLFRKDISIKVSDEKKFKVVEKLKRTINEEGIKVIKIDGVKVVYKDLSSILIRPSNTQPLIRISITSDKKEKINELEEVALGFLSE